LQDAPCAPKPTGALPLLVGTGSPRMSRITARWADEWNTWGDPAEVGRRTERFLAACDVVGRDPGTVRRSAQALVFLGKATDEFVVDRSLSGSDEQLVDALNRYVALGVDEFAIPDFTLGETAAARADALAHLHANVLPHVG
jgi:alkanesulfonate monooxygenase SsuD/methylene tetrahydromethanopterin reductase-like flavin-dependent oxidoreductase (luciferase family)